LASPKLTHLLSSDHIHWIDDALIRALQLAPPSLSISIHIHVTGAPATIEALPQSYGPNDDAKRRGNDSCSEVMDLQEAQAMEKSKESLLAIESVKIENGRPNLSAMLKDEVEMATGRMSVSGQSSSPRTTGYNDAYYIFSVWLAGDCSICSSCSSVPSV